MREYAPPFMSANIHRMSRVRHPHTGSTARCRVYVGTIEGAGTRHEQVNRRVVRNRTNKELLSLVNGL